MKITKKYDQHLEIKEKVASCLRKLEVYQRKVPTTLLVELVNLKNVSVKLEFQNYNAQIMRIDEQAGRGTDAIITSNAVK